MSDPGEQWLTIISKCIIHLRYRNLFSVISVTQSLAHSVINSRGELFAPPPIRMSVSAPHEYDMNILFMLYSFLFVPFCFLVFLCCAFFLLSNNPPSPGEGARFKWYCFLRGAFLPRFCPVLRSVWFRSGSYSASCL